MRTLNAIDAAPPGANGDSSHWSVRAAIAASRPTALVAAVVVAIAAVGSVVHPDVPAAAALTVIAMIPAVLVDVLVRRLPNRLVGGAALAGAAAVAVSLAIGLELRLLDAAIGAAAMSVPLLLAHLISPSSMGFGDVKAALVLGAAVGLIDPVLPIVALAAGSLGAAAHGLATRSKTIAFGPGLLGGAVLVMVLTASPFGPLSQGQPETVLFEQMTSAIR